MTLFKRKNSSNSKSTQADLAEAALNTINDGVIITDKAGVIQFINPAAVLMTNCSSAHNAIGLDYGLIIKLQSKEGREYTERENPLMLAMKMGQGLEPTQASIVVAQSGQNIPVSINVQVMNNAAANRIITFRNISKELEEEGEQTEFISTASHEMRTPVATIDGYISLCLNPQTATIDDRARGYLTAAEKASKHLGKLFQDLLDVTKLDDGRIKPHFEPVEMIELIQGIANDYEMRAKDAKLNYTFGSSEPVTLGGNRRMSQVVYGFIDVSFMQEIMGNLIENAIKYTPAGGSIYINVRGDGDRILINVTDTGMGISAEDLTHIFQKFYRVDNSDTRTIGGTGLGLYLVKQRAEAMGGKVWAESAFGEGSTFYVSLPRITSEEYDKRMLAVKNQQMIMNDNPAPQPTVQSAFQVAEAPNQIQAAPDQNQAAPMPQAAPVPQQIPQQIPQPTPAPTPQPTPVVPQPASASQPAPTSPVAPQPASATPQPIPTAPITPQPAPAPQPALTPQPAPPTPQPIPETSSPPINQSTNSTVQPNNNNNLNGESK